MNPSLPKTVCDCPCCALIIKNNNVTHAILSLYGMHLSFYSCMPGDPLHVQLRNTRTTREGGGGGGTDVRATNSYEDFQKQDDHWSCIATNIANAESNLGSFKTVKGFISRVFIRVIRISAPAFCVRSKGFYIRQCYSRRCPNTTDGFRNAGMPSGISWCFFVPSRCPLQPPQCRQQWLADP